MKFRTGSSGHGCPYKPVQRGTPRTELDKGVCWGVTEGQGVESSHSAAPNQRVADTDAR